MALLAFATERRAGNGIYGMRMLSPIGANVQFCCNYYGMSPNDIPYVKKG